MLPLRVADLTYLLLMGCNGRLMSVGWIARDAGLMGIDPSTVTSRPEQATHDGFGLEFEAD